MLQFVKETQIITISNTEWSTRLADHKIIFTIFLGATYTFKYYKWLSVSCMCCVYLRNQILSNVCLKGKANQEAMSN